MKMTRYEIVRGVESPMNFFDDVCDWLSNFKSEDYLVQVLVSVHGYTKVDAKKRAAKIVPHARYALDYIAQTQSSKASVSFLPAYYAVLNLAKIIILAGPYEKEFKKQTRWHGATYAVNKKDSQSLFTDEIRLRPGGALALLYKTLTDTEITNDRTLKMGNIYGFMPEIGVEYQTLTGAVSQLSHMYYSHTLNRDGEVIAKVEVGDQTHLPKGFSQRWVAALSGYKKQSRTVFTKNLGKLAKGEKVEQKIRSSLRTQYLFHCSHCNGSVTPISNSNIKFTHEFPIALAFFHMSSVSRYKPEFLDKLINSKYWPLLLTSRRYGLYHFMLDTWNYVHQCQYTLNSP